MERDDSREHTTFAELPVLGGIGVLSATYRSHCFAPHAHDTFAIGVFDSGAAVIRSDNVSLTAGISDILIIPPGAVHSAWSAGAEEWRYRAFYPSQEIIESVVHEAEGGAGPKAFGRHVVRHDRLARGLRSSLAAVETRTAPMAMEELLITALQDLWTHASGRPVSPVPARGSPHAVRRARDYIDAHWAGPVSLETVADVAGVTRHRLILDFKRRLRITPYAYLIQRRIGEARRMLAAGLGTARAAATCGFVDQSHLSRHFKRLVGVTPGVYASGVRRPSPRSRH